MRFETGFALILVVLSGAFAFATPQQPDLLIVDGTARQVHGFRFPDELQMKIFERARSDKRWIVSSSNWRGFEAVLQVRDSKLFLIGIRFGTYERQPSPAEILGYEIPKDGVPLASFSGTLVSPTGPTLGYLHNSVAGDQTAQVLLHVFEQGVLMKSELKDQDASKEMILRSLEKDMSIISDLQRKISGADSDDPFSPEE